MVAIALLLVERGNSVERRWGIPLCARRIQLTPLPRLTTLCAFNS